MDIQEENVFFASETLALAGRLAYDAGLAATSAKVLICPPHPFLGGDMENNVVRQLHLTLAAAGFMAFCFNYRGIGQSESDRDLQQEQRLFWENSTCPDYEACIHDDCRAALQWLEPAWTADTPVHLVGYSFGCLPALSLSRQQPIQRLALISPPLTQWTITKEQVSTPLPRALFFATGDFACPETDIETLYAQMPEPKSLARFVDSDHFFIGQETQLAEAVCRFLVSADD
ncbi:MAG: hypothetical protein CVV13_14915 [Gammaproteobacteria bacterium HGW-Gammaproteobacteria-3]|nr:MAG: hypothetical protein CVV13_14915 [Gammaproteobacteria bacterium HGW-Gammaproteobacteria-3]